MQCISRVTNDDTIQKFGDGYHNFYLEYRCNSPCKDGMDVCERCSKKSDSTKIQASRTFNHGKITEQIPDNSHIYGGKWYNDNIKRYQPPPNNIIELAEEYKLKARQQPPKVSESQEIIPQKEASSKPVKSRRKPKIADDIEDSTDFPKSSKKQSTNKKSSITPYSSLISSKTQLVHKEVTLPTHIETKLDEIDIDGFKIEYVKLSSFEHNGSTYFIDSKKNKLYKNIKGKIGQYIGRLHLETNNIVTDVPDSDEEN
jgi:hypothetical protein